MTNTPRISPLPLEQLRTRQIENLPPIPPRQCPLHPIRLLQPCPNLLFIPTHRDQPILTRLPIVHPINPPLVFQLEVILEEQQQISRGHRPAREKMLRHPPSVEIIGCASVREYVHEELPTRFQGARYFGKQGLVVFHVFEQFDGYDSVVLFRFEFIIDHVAGDDAEVREALGFGDGVDVFFLSAGVGEGGDGAVGEHLGEEEGG
jgi:hypothetical protein